MQPDQPPLRADDLPAGGRGAWFTVVHLLPGGSREHHQQLYADLVSLGLTGLLVGLLRRRGGTRGWLRSTRGRRWAGLDIASDAHVDALAVLLGVVGLELLVRRRPGFGGALLDAAVAVAVLLLTATVVAVLRSDPAAVPVTVAALWTVGAALLVANPAQPWYSILLVALAVIEGRPEWLAVAIAAYPTYFTALLMGRRLDWSGGASYAAAAVLVLVATVARNQNRRVSAARGTQGR